MRSLPTPPGVCGVDEAGRGPIAGPVYAAAVILPPRARLPGLDDSKKVPPGHRIELAGAIRAQAIAWAVAWATVEEIDRINIFHASLLAMQRAVRALAVMPAEVWVDGTHVPMLACPARALVQGDGKVRAIAAASILAKTERDAEMERLAARFPVYGFERHKGYATPEHLEALARNGPCEVYRRSFAPVREALGLDALVQPSLF
jgi:ribonuclease HII